MSRIDRAARPTKLTQADRARMAAAIAAHDKRIKALAARERLARLAIFCSAIVIAVAIFYSL